MKFSKFRHTPAIGLIFRKNQGRLSAAIFLCAFLGLAMGTSLRGEESSTSNMEKALRERSRGDYQNAVLTLKRAIQMAKRPNQKVLAQFMLADCLMELKQPMEAKAVFEQIISVSKEPDEEAEARFRIAQCYAMSGDQDRMKIFCADLIKRFPRTPYAELARFLTKSGRVKVLSNASIGKPLSAPLPTEDISPVSTLENVEDPEPASGNQRNGTPSGGHATPPGFSPASAKAAQAEPREPPPVKPLHTVLKPKSEEKIGTPSPIRIVPGSGQVASPLIPDSSLTREGKTASVSPPKEKSPDESVEDIPASRPTSASPVAKGGPAPALIRIPSGIRAPTDLLVFSPMPQYEKEALATEILKDQNILAAGGSAPDADEVMFRLASRTAQFGEIVEACKLYDKLLTAFPTSPFVEDAYFEAIRLRAILKIFTAVISWGKGFQNTFLKSSHLEDVKRLIEYARNANKPRPAVKPAKSQAPGNPASSNLETAGESKAVLKNARYREGKRLMKAGKYSLALADFQKLSLAYPNIPLVFWELALVQVQLKKFTEAEKSLQSLLALDSDNEEARSLMGFVHFQQKNYQQAAVDYTQAGETAGEGLEFFNSRTAAQRLSKSQ